MKFLRKINKGLILTIIVLLILVIYLVNVELTRNKEKPEIEKLCQEYIDMINGYCVTPEEIGKLYTPEEKQEKAKEIEEKMDKAIKDKKDKIDGELKKFMIDNKNAIDIQKNAIEEYIDGIKGMTDEIIVSYDKDISKVKKYKFDGDQVVVTFDTKGAIEKKHLVLDENTMEYKEETKRENTTGYEESITLKKEDGEWKVTYAALNYTMPEQSGIQTTQVIMGF